MIEYMIKVTKLERKHWEFLEKEFSLSESDIPPLTSKQKSNLYRALQDIELMEIDDDNDCSISERGKTAVYIADYLYDTYYQQEEE